MTDIEHIQARLEALWWANQRPDYWVITRGPEHITDPLGYFEIELYEHIDSDRPLGDSIVRFQGDTMDEVLDQLVAWRVEARLA